MSADYVDQGLDRELTREQLVTAALQGQLALITGDDEQVSQWLGELAVTLADDTEVVRLDASQTHTAAGLVQALVQALNVVPDDLLEALVRRGENLPLVLVVDNGECLGSRALDALRNLMAKGRSGLGVLIGGEPELSELLARARIKPAYQTAATQEPGSESPEPTGAVTRPWRELVPWKHLAAVAALLLLVWIFWPGDSVGERSDELALPAPDASEARSRDQGAGPAGTDPPDERAEPEPPSGAGGPGKPTPEADASDEPAAAATDPGPARDGAEPEPVLETPPERDEPEEVEPTGLDADLAYRREDWLLTRSPDRWMLQLALAADKERARELLDRLGTDRGAYYRARREGGVAYIVLAGPYGSRDQALGARSGLPGFLRDRGPFPRRIKAIMSEIREQSETAPGRDDAG